MSRIPGSDSTLHAGLKNLRAHMEDREGLQDIHTIEPKVLRAAALALYAGTGASAASAIPPLLPRTGVRRPRARESGISAACHDGEPGSVFELGQLLEEGMLAPFIHFGGQNRRPHGLRPASGFGSNVYTDFMIVPPQPARLNGVVEFDCRPPRTTTSCQGLTGFLNGAVGYWQMLEDKVAAYFADKHIAELEGALMAAEDSTVASLLTASSVTKGVGQLRAGFKGFAAAANGTPTSSRPTNGG